MREMRSTVRMRLLEPRGPSLYARRALNGNARKRSLAARLRNPDFLKNELSYISLYVPALMLFLVFVIFPLFQAFYLSLTDWDGIRPRMNFIGLDNYRVLIGDDYILRTFAE